MCVCGNVILKWFKETEKNTKKWSNKIDGIPIEMNDQQNTIETKIIAFFLGCNRK